MNTKDLPERPPKVSARSQSLQLNGGDPEPLGQSRREWCLPDPSPGRVPLQPLVLVVTLPEPRSTHLPLYFDRTIEAIEAAAAEHGLYLSRYWLPWQPPGRAATARNASEQGREDRIVTAFRLEQPGMLLLTAAPEAGQPGRPAFVFLVAESPISGINRSQFRNAVNYAKSLCPDEACRKDTLHIVGPFFSGSAPSALDLARYIQEQGMTSEFVSGSMSSRAQQALLTVNGVSAEFVLPDDECAEDFLFRFLTDQHLSVDGHNIAILAEEETRFGSNQVAQDSQGRGAATQCARPYMPYVHRISFPRELSELRNASPDSFGRAGVTVRDLPLLVQDEGPAWNWSDVGGGADSVPAYSGGQEPLSVQSVLSSISDLIRQEDVEYVGVEATDIFDILFLSDFLKTATPNVRLFVLDSDLLMVNSQNRELDGTLAVTTYPLIHRAEEWAKSSAGPRASSGHPLEVFPSRLTQGVCTAVSRQLARAGATDEAASVCSSQPGPLWLTMVGRSGFWPVNVDSSKQPTTAPPTDPVTAVLQNALLLLGLIHLLGMLASTRLAQAAIPARAYPWLEQFRIRVRSRASNHAQDQSFHLLSATLAIGAMLALVVISSAGVWMRVDGAPEPTWTPSVTDGYRLVAALLLLGAAALLTALTPARAVPAGVLAIPWAAYSLIVGGWIWLASREGPTGMFFAHRAFYLSNGVSPLLPVEILLLVLYVWAMSLIRTVRLSESKRITVPELDKLGPLGEGLENGCAQLISATEPLLFNQRETFTTTAIFSASAFVILQLFMTPWEAMTSVEGLAYDRYFVALFLFVCMLTVATWGRYVLVWVKMRRMLRGLERTPLRKAFSRMPDKVYSWSSLWYENAERRAYVIAARSLQCFQAIVNRGGYRNGDGTRRVQEMTAAFQDVVAAAQGVHRADEGTDPAEHMQGVLRNTAETLLEHELRPHWERSGGSDTLDEMTKSREHDADTHKGDGTATPVPDRDLILLEEEFVALRYVGLIHYESAQLKNMVVFLTTSFVLLLLSVGSYPFVGGRLLVWKMAAVFLFFGAAIAASFAQMARDAILSRLDRTTVGKLDLSFLLRLISYGALPLLALLASQFPSFARSLVSWLEPALNAMH